MTSKEGLLGGSDRGRRSSVNKLPSLKDTLGAQTVQRNSTLMSTIFTSWNITIGVGILALPRAFALVGYVNASIGLFLCSALCMVTFEMLARAMREVEDYTFGGVMYITCGPRIAWLTDFIIWVFVYGVLIVYTQVCAAIMEDVLEVWGALPIDPASDGFLDNRRFFVLLFGLFAYWPLCLLPSLHFLRHVSLLATASMCYVVVVVLVRVFESLSAGDGACLVADLDCGALPCACGEVFVWNGNGDGSAFLNYASAFSTFSFALTTHTALPPMLSELQEPTPRRSLCVILAMTWFSFGLYLVTGLSGYALFGERQCPIISNSFGVDDRWMQAGQLMVVACVTGGYPVNQIQARISLDSLIQADRWICTGKKRRCYLQPATVRKMTTSTLQVLSATLVAFFVEDLNAVIDLAGAFGGATTAFFLPPLAYMNVSLPQEWSLCRKLRTWQGLCVILGALLASSLTAFTIYSIATESAGEDIGTQTCGVNP